MSAAETSREIRQGLVADTQGRKYAPAVQRQGEAQSVLGTEPPTPMVADAKPSPQRQAPVAPRTSPAMPAPAPSASTPAPAMTSKAPPSLPTVGNLASAPAQPPLPEMSKFAPPAPPANAMMGAADEFETVVISGEGVQRTSGWDTGASNVPATVAIAPMAMPMTMAEGTGAVDQGRDHPVPARFRPGSTIAILRSCARSFN